MGRPHELDAIDRLVADLRLSARDAMIVSGAAWHAHWKHLATDARDAGYVEQVAIRERHASESYVRLLKALGIESPPMPERIACTTCGATFLASDGVVRPGTGIAESEAWCVWCLSDEDDGHYPLAPEHVGQRERFVVEGA